MASLEGAILKDKGDGYVSDEEAQDGETSSVPPPTYDGMPQTGPKGVIMDYHRHMQDKEFREAEKKRERCKAIEQSVPTVKTWREEHTGSSDHLLEALQDINPDTDPFTQEYRARRLQEMKEHAKAGRKRMLFGNFLEIRGDKFDDVIESVSDETFLVIHIYDDFVVGCRILNNCLTKLARTYQTVKFVRVQSHSLGVSKDFEQKAMPALLVYKKGDLVGNHLRITDNLGDDFTEKDVEKFLRQSDCLPNSRDARALSPFSSQALPKRSSSPDDSSSD